MSAPAPDPELALWELLHPPDTKTLPPEVRELLVSLHRRGTSEKEAGDQPQPSFRDLPPDTTTLPPEVREELVSLHLRGTPNADHETNA